MNSGVRQQVQNINDDQVCFFLVFLSSNNVVGASKRKQKIKELSYLMEVFDLDNGCF